MRVYVMTDLEAVAGVRDFDDWCVPEGRYYDLAQKFLTLEVNAAVDGLFAGGATEILVADGHGCGAINIELLDPRVEMMRGWPRGWPLHIDDADIYGDQAYLLGWPRGWPLHIDDGHFDALIFVGQHAKAGTDCAHLAHTQGLNYIDLSINGVSIGEFGQMAMCAAELGIPSIFGSGDLAFTKEAEALAPGIVTVAVMRGTTPGSGDDLTIDAYRRRNAPAVHLHPERARQLIRTGAEQAMRKFRSEGFGLIPLKAPFKRVARFRPEKAGDLIRISHEEHPTSLAGVMNMRFAPVPES